MTNGIDTLAARPGMPAARPVRLIADDLTGALDAAAQFTRLAGAVPVHWSHLPSEPGASIAIDSATREADRAGARRKVHALASAIAQAPGAIVYAKLDSLLRGHAGAEIAAWADAMRPAHIIVAPAFPAQDRVTRDGRQYVRAPQGLMPVATDLAADLGREGLSVRHCRPGEAVPGGISLWDADTDTDLDAVAATGLALPGPVLWCGSAGLAGALSRVLGAPASADDGLPLAGPVLGLIGTDHPVMQGQLAACAADVLSLPDGSDASADAVALRLKERRLALVTLALPEGLTRRDAASRIERDFAALAARLDPPGTLIVAGGETLRGLCDALGATRLDTGGQLMPGIPRSIMRGGRFEGVTIISKSGAFGGSELLLHLLHPGIKHRKGVPA